MSESSQPIGLFDSGFGGLTVMKEVIRYLPRENLVYLGDTARLPYGNKSPESICRYSLENIHFLLKKNIKLLIIPCHTACTHALKMLQDRFSLPIIGVIESGIDLLLKSTSSFEVAVLGTSSTIRSKIYSSLIQKRAPQATVYSIACPLFVPLVEENFFDHPAAELIAEFYLNPLNTTQIDTALLACTHYPLLRPIIQKTLGSHIQLIEPAEQCALQALEILKTTQLLNTQNKAPQYEFYATDDPEKFRQWGKLFLGSEISTVHLS